MRAPGSIPQAAISACASRPAPTTKCADEQDRRPHQLIKGHNFATLRSSPPGRPTPAAELLGKRGRDDIDGGAAVGLVGCSDVR